MSTEHQWKQFMQGLGNGLLDEYYIAQVNSTHGEDAVREYHDNFPRLVARMTVKDSLTDKPSQECEREYWIQPYLLELVSDIVILTQEDWHEFDEFDGDDREWLSERGIDI